MAWAAGKGATLRVQRARLDYSEEQVRLAAPASVAELPLEVVYSAVALVIMVALILLVCCCWCSKSRQRKHERFERKNSLRMSRSSMGSRSMVSVASNGFSDINYR